MDDLFEKAMHFISQDEGLTMVEYAVAGSLITAAAVTAFTDLGTAVTGKVTTITGAITAG
jgi:pilus assembly protein Flp/PilA